MSSVLWTLAGLGFAGFGGWIFGYTRGVRESADETATLRAANDMLSTRVQSLETALLASKAAPISHDDAVTILREAANGSAEAG